jgi:hypothetical protein
MSLPDSHATKAALEKVANGEAAAFLRSLAGGLSLHASAVAHHGAALMMIGPSGAGKSTTAAAMCSGFGASLLADDVAGLELAPWGLRALPSEGSSWLDDGCGNKRSVATRVATQPADVKAIVWLSFDESLRSPRVVRVRGSAIVSQMLEALLRFDLAPTVWEREFELLSRLTEDIQLLSLSRSRRVSPEQTAQLVASFPAGQGML